MVGLDEEAEPQLIVPQNSLTNLRTKMGLSERNSNLQASINANTLRDSEPATSKCKHCENMAKNFLYLESLMRTNYDPNHQCSLCYSAIKYLQYVNKSIMHIFGNCESIMQAAKSFSVTPIHTKKKLPTLRKDKLKSVSQASNTSTKSKQSKKKNKPSVKRQEGGGIANLQASFQSSRSIVNRKTKTTKITKKPKKKKNIKKTQLSTHSVRTAEGAPENGSKVRRPKKAKRKITKSSVVVRVLNQKSTKEKRKKMGKT